MTERPEPAGDADAAREVAAVLRAQVAPALQARVEGSVEVDAPVGMLTTFRTPGRAAVLVEAASESDLLEVGRATADGQLPVAVLGRGSNALVSDQGFAGVLVRLGAGFRRHDHDGGAGLRLGGALHLPAAAKLTARLGLKGFEFAAEIPGSLGGAVRMNAGAHGRSMADVLVSARIVDLGLASARDVEAEDLHFGYRVSAVGERQVVTSGRLRLEPGDPQAVADAIAANIRWRREHQPAGRSAGSVFKNPEGDSAGRLIEAAGLKGARIGGAEISPVHANFIVTRPGASAADVAGLAALARAKVQERFGIQLELEVWLLGPFPQLKRRV